MLRMTPSAGTWCRHRLAFTCCDHLISREQSEPATDPAVPHTLLHSAQRPEPPPRRDLRFQADELVRQLLTVAPKRNLPVGVIPPDRIQRVARRLGQSVSQGLGSGWALPSPIALAALACGALDRLRRLQREIEKPGEANGRILFSSTALKIGTGNRWRVDGDPQQGSVDSYRNQLPCSASRARKTHVSEIQMGETFRVT
jgi:hypothetical protein